MGAARATKRAGTDRAALRFAGVPQKYPAWLQQSTEQETKELAVHLFVDTALG